MYTVAVQRAFVAQHYLIGGDWGAENSRHSHNYRLEVQLQGTNLDRNGYLVDIIEIEAHLDELVARFRDQTLNDLSEFATLNPSIEHFTRIFCQAFAARITVANIEAVTVQIWETDIAWASFRLQRAGADAVGG